MYVLPIYIIRCRQQGWYDCPNCQDMVLLTFKDCEYEICSTYNEIFTRAEKGLKIYQNLKKIT